jgi:hypothetical protein
LEPTTIIDIYSQQHMQCGCQGEGVYHIQTFEGRPWSLEDLCVGRVEEEVHVPKRASIMF